MTGRTVQTTLPRRVVLGSGVGVAALALMGCGVRLEEDAPDLPFVTRRAKVPGESILLALTAECRELAVTAAAAGDPVGTALAALHTVQAQTLHDQLRAAGVPSTVAVPSPSAAASGGTPEAVDRAQVLADEGKALEDVDRYAGLAKAFAPAVLSLLAQRAAGVRWLEQAGGVGEAPTPNGSGASPNPSPSPSLGSDAVSLPTGFTAEGLTALSGTRYLLEVMLPHAVDPERALATATLAFIRASEQSVTTGLGPDAPPPVLGVPYPPDLTTPAAQRAMIAAALSQTISTYGRGLTVVADTRLRDGLAIVPTEFGELLDWGRQWGIDLTPFPGLS